jgi:hypothetical protein
MTAAKSSETKRAQHEVVATRQTFDGVTVYLHADGALSTRMAFVGGGNLPLAAMWRFVGDICLMTFAELVGEVRAEKRGQRRLFTVRDWVPESQQVWAAGPVLANGVQMTWRIR